MFEKAANFHYVRLQKAMTNKDDIMVLVRFKIYFEGKYPLENIKPM